MESRLPQNPEFRNNPENFHACLYHIRDLIGFFHSCGKKNKQNIYYS